MSFACIIVVMAVGFKELPAIQYINAQHEDTLCQYKEEGAKQPVPPNSLI